MPYSRQLRRGAIVWMASYYVPNELLPLSKRSTKASVTRIKESATSAGYPNTEKAAGQLENRRKSEIAAGTYSYESAVGEHTAETWLNEWTESRGSRYKQGDKRRVEMHFLTFRDFRNKPLSSFRTEDFKAWGQNGKRLVEQEKAMSSKNFWTIYGVVHAMFQDATDSTKIPFNPCNVDGKSDMPRKKSKRGRKYDEAEVQELAWCEALPADVRMLFCGLAFTGERVGEFCGHIWSDWDRSAAPLTSLTLEFQYNREPLKGDTDKERPRVIPVHDELRQALEWWWSEGWAAFVGRAPRPSDPIFPNVFKQGHHTEKSVYHRAKDAFDKAQTAGLVGAAWKAHHALRHAFTTALVGRGASPVWVERITHNASGKLVDPTTRMTVNHYTHTEWKPLCDAVALLPWRRVIAGPEGSGSGLATSGANGSEGHETAGKEGAPSMSQEPGFSHGFQDSSGFRREFESLLPLKDSSEKTASSDSVWPGVWPSESEGADFVVALREAHGSVASRAARPPSSTSDHAAKLPERSEADARPPAKTRPAYVARARKAAR